MDYFSGNTLIREYPSYTGNQGHSISYYNNDIDLLLSQITPPLGDLVSIQPPINTLQCVPEMQSYVNRSTTVYQVPENMPVEAILQQFGVNSPVVQQSNSTFTCYRNTCSPVEISFLPSRRRRRRIICQEVSDSEDDHHHRRSSHPPQRSSSSAKQSGPPPTALHDVLSNVWNKAKNAPHNLQESHSAPDINSAWQRMRNASPPMSPSHQHAVDHVWNRAEYATDPSAHRSSNNFNRMPSPPQNVEAVGNFFAARNATANLNRPNSSVANVWNRADNAVLHMPPQQPPPMPQNREAVNNFFAARNASNNFNQPNSPVANVWNRADYAAQHMPPQPPPMQQNHEAVNNFYAARAASTNFNQPNSSVANVWNRADNAVLHMPPQQPPPMPQNREAANNFFAARNASNNFNQPNSPVANVWNRADNAIQQMPPSRSSPPPMNSVWNSMQQGQPNQYRPSSPTNVPLGRINNGPAPASFGDLLSRSQRNSSSYAGFT